MPSSSSSSDSSSSDTEVVWTENDGELTDDDGETAADPTLRGQCALVTASCPKQYPRDIDKRKAKNIMIPADLTKEEFLREFRRVWDANSTVTLEKASCHDEPHQRFRPSQNRRERHKHIAIKCAKTFAHKRIAERFHAKCGIHVHFSFKHKGFAGYLRYLTTPGKKASADLDLHPATYPPSLDIKKEAGEAFQSGLASNTKSRTRLSFDDVSNIIIEGTGSGPIRTARALEDAAAKMKRDGNTELWNYLGAIKSSSDVRALVTRVWRMIGELSHPMWKPSATYPLSTFSVDCMPEVMEWASKLHKSHTLVLAGRGGLGKTQLAKALMSHIRPGGFWFLDDPDDFREIGDELEERHGLVVDEVCLADLAVNQVKKMFDLEETRRISCRYINATIPAGCPRIYVTNSSEHEFYPKMTSRDATGVKRRQIFVEVARDVRRRTVAGTTVAGTFV